LELYSSGSFATIKLVCLLTLFTIDTLNYSVNNSSNGLSLKPENAIFLPK
jgi:hypothetical protein